MTAYTHFVVEFVVNKADAEGNCVCGSRVAHQHILVTEVYPSDTDKIIDQDIIFLEDSELQAATMTRMCRKAMHLTQKEAKEATV